MVKLYFGIKKADARDSVDLIFDLNGVSVIVGDKSTSNWGIPCDEARNSCKKSSEDVNYRFDNFFQFFFNTASIFATFDANMDITKPQEKDKLRFNLVQPNPRSNPWYLGDVGVLGLAPQSTFANYIRGISGHPFRLGFQFYTQD